MVAAFAGAYFSIAGITRTISYISVLKLSLILPAKDYDRFAAAEAIAKSRPLSAAVVIQPSRSQDQSP